MKKLFVLFLTLFTSAILFFSCDPHAEGNTVTINIDAEAIKSIFNNNRVADSTNNRDGYFYARLVGSEGTIYEKTAYFVYPENGPVGLSTQLTFTGVTYRETYNLYVYVVNEGRSVAYGYREPFELNRFGPTRVPITLSFDLASNVDGASWNNLIVNNEDPNGNYTIKDEDGYISPTKVTDNANVTFTVSSAPYYDFDFYVLHNGKQTNITATHGEGNEYIFTYVFKEEGNYTVACRVTDPDTHLFKTAYLHINFKSNKIDSNYVIYDNQYQNRTNVWYQNSYNDSNIYSKEPTYINASANNFDFCFDENSNIYCSDGNNIYLNWNKDSAFISANGKTIKSISYDAADNYLVVCSSTNKMVGIANLNNSYNGGYYGIQWADDPNKNNDSYTLNNIVACNNTAYIFYNYKNSTSWTNQLIVQSYNIEENKNGTGVMDIKDSLVGAYKIAEISINSGLWEYPDGFPFNISDAIVYNNNIYFLSYFDVEEWYDTQYFGFIGKINLSTSEITILDSSDMTIQSLTDSNFVNTKYYYLGYGLGYYSNEKIKKFIRPQRFIAIKPKSLIISDDGRLYWTDSEQYWDEYHEWDSVLQSYIPGYSSRNIMRYKNANRVITVSVENFAITDIKKLDTIKWLNEKTSDYENAASGEFIRYTPN